MENRAQGAVVCADGARAVHVASAAPAAGTERGWDAGGPPRGQRIAAAITQRGRERKNRSPTAFAHGPKRGAFKKLAAGSAGRSEENGEDGI